MKPTQSELDYFMSIIKEYPNIIKGDWRTLEKEGIKTWFGAEKICLEVEGMDWVIKANRDENESSVKVEFENYNKAVAAGFEEYFPATYKLTNDWYIQKKAEVSEDKNEDSLYDYAKTLVDRKENEDEDDYLSRVSDASYNLNDSDRIVAMLGYSDRIKELIEFCENNYINDLHEGNWGEIAGRKVIIDFCGY